MLLTFALSLSALAAAPPARPPAPGDSAHVVLVATTDVHGRATAWDYYTDREFAGGLTRAATAVDSLRKAYPGQVVLVDAGDLIQGEPFATYFARVAPRDPHPIVETMNRIGYDAATLGNHEFNFGLDVLRRALAGAAFPYVSANVYALPGDTLAYPPYVVLRRGAVRIAIAGLTTPGVMVWDRDVVKGKMRVAPIALAAPRALAAMRRDADLSVVLIHSGMDGPSSYDTTGVGPEDVAARLATLTDRPDVVVVGHSHKEMRDSVLAGVHFVQPKNYAQSLTVTHVDLVRRDGRWRVARVRGDLVPLAGVAPKAALARQLEPARENVRDWVRTPLADALGPMPAAFARAEPTALVEWINAVERERTGADLASTPVFNVRAGFDAGPVTLAEVAAVYPYENTLRAVRISGDQLRRYLEQSARYFTLDASGRARIDDSVPGYNYDIVSGAGYTLDLSRPVGQRVRDLAVRGRPVAPTDSFTFALNSYRQGGGGGYDMLKGAPVVYDRGENVRDLLADALRRAGRLDPKAYAARDWRLAPDSLAADIHRAFVAPGVPGAPAREGGDSVLLRVLTLNDLHGALLPRAASWSKGALVGGAAALKATMDSAEARCGCPTLRVDAGDEMQGTLISNLVHGRTTIDVMNRLGIQAAAVGNHDFDWSVDTLRARMREARYPWLIANALDSASGARAPWTVPWAIVETHGLRVGVIGWITRETKSIVAAKWVKGLAFPGDAERLRATVAEVKAKRPDVTILLAHVGAECDSLGCRGEIVDLARALGPDALDLIVAGHSHKRVVTQVAGIPIIEAFSSGSAVGVVDLVRKPGGGTRGHVRVQTTYVDSVTPDPELTGLVSGWRARSDSLASVRIATLKTPLPHTDDDGAPSALGDLLADGLRSVARADVGLMNNGGIRASLPAGPVTYGMLFEVQPFQNALVRIRLTGAELREVLEHALSGERPSAHVSGITARYDPRRPAGRRVLAIRRAGGKPIRDADTVTLATLDFLASGGSGFTMLVGKPTEVTGLTDVDALILYLRRLPSPIEARPAGGRLLGAR